METIKSIELLGEFKFDEIYYFYKTSSSEKNLEILSYLKKYQTSINFFSHFTNTDIKSLINFLNELDRQLTSIFNEEPNEPSKFPNNTEKYISKISKIILILNLTQRTQEMLNSILSKTKHYFNEIFTNFKYDIIYQEKLLFLMNNLQYNFSNDLAFPNKKVSRISTKVNSRQISSQDLLENKNEINNDDTIKIFFEKNKNSIVNEECLSDIYTPGFQILEKKIKEHQSKKNIINSNQGIYIQKESTLSLSDMIFTHSQEDKNNHASKKKIGKKRSNTNVKLRSKKNSFVPPCSNFKKLSESFSHDKKFLHNSKGNSEEIKMFSDLLILIKKLYKFCLINSEERIKLKKLVIEKSKPIFEFYCKIFKNNKTNYKKLADEIKKLFNICEKKTV